MKINYLSFVLVVAACIGCGGNNPIPTKGKFNSGSTAEGIQFNQNKQDFTDQQNSFTKTNIPRTQLGNTSITPKDDFPNHEIISPAKEFDVPNEHYQMTAEMGTTFTYDQTGSKVSIPADALVDKNGNEVKGGVDISYREFHTQKDIFFSGIPMDYDVNGEKHFFESAGMIDIRASQNGEDVFLKKGKEINFLMSTDNQNEEVKLYELDQKTKKWSEIGKAPVVTTPKMRQKTWAPVYINDTTPERTRYPFRIYVDEYLTKYDPAINDYKRKLRFKIYMPKNISKRTQLNKNDFKHVNWLNNSIFEVEGIKRTEFKKIMDQFRKLKKEDEPYRYPEIHADVSITNVNYPNMTMEFSFQGKRFEMDVQLYYNFARSEKSKRKIFDAIANFPINEFAGRHSVIRHNEYCIDHYDSLYPGSNEDWNNKYLIQREFQAQNFGVLNCDQPLKMPNDAIANAAFMVDGKETNPEFAVLVDFKRNCLFTYYQSAFGKFGYDPKADNFVFTVFDDGNVGYILPDEFGALKGSKLKVPLHLVDMQNFGKIMDALFPKKTEQSYNL